MREKKHIQIDVTVILYREIYYYFLIKDHNFIKKKINILHHEPKLTQPY